LAKATSPTPFGGFKQSGFGGRDNGIHAHDQYTQIKTIWVDLADDEDEAVAWLLGKTNAGPAWTGGLVCHLARAT
jgi:acyl-CoA reductase-like NAD-dependent aldehyde dehydrogenase